MSKLHTCLTTIICIIFVGLISLKTAEASNFEAIGHEVLIEILEDGSAQYTAQLNLKNNDSTNLISGYSYIIPSANTGVVTIDLNGNIINPPVYKTQDNLSSILDINFGDNVIKPGEEKKMRISVSLPNFVNEKFSTRYLLLNTSSDLTFSYKVRFPKSFNPPVFISTHEHTIKEFNENTYEIIFSNIKPTFIVWGDEYYIDIESRLVLNNQNDNEETTYFQILPDLEGQRIFYKTIFSGEYGIEDKFSNRFAFIRAPESTEIDAGYEAKIYKSRTDLSFVSDQHYNFGWPDNNKVVKDINIITQDESNTIEILRKANDRLIRNYPLEFSSAKPFDNPLEQWNSIEAKNSFNSFDYVYVLTSLVEQIGGKAEVRYGYVILDNSVEEIIQPHFWLIAEIEDERFIVDPYQQIVSGLDYFGADNDFDRLNVGYWHPKNETFGALGLFSNKPDSPVKKISLKDFGDFISENNAENYVDGIINSTSEKIYSGFFYSASLELTNNLNNFLLIEQVRFNSDNYKFKNLPENYYLGILPNKKNVIELDSLRNNNFLFVGKKEDSITLIFRDSTINDITLKNLKEFSIHPLTILILPVLSFFTIIIFLIYKIAWKRFKR